jgi:hypothetical protein
VNPRRLDFFSAARILICSVGGAVRADNLEEFMKSILAIVVIGLIVAIFVAERAWQQKELTRFSTTGPGDNESHGDKVARYRAGADAALREACTNAVIGLRSIIAMRGYTADDNFMKWTGSAKVEFFNQIGGVERTNLNFKFVPSLAGQANWFVK